MKKLTPLLLCILLLTSCAATYDGPTQEQPMLTEYYSRHISSITGNVWENRMTFAYDIYGNQVQRMEYEDGKLTDVTKLRYDENGNEIACTYWDHSHWIPYIRRRVTQSYDDRNRLISYASYNMWGLKTDWSTYTYDDEAHSKTMDNDSGSRVTYYYDENGRKLRDIDSNGSETVYEYDNRGNQIGLVSTINGVIEYRYEAGFDDRNRILWHKHYNQGVLSAHTIYTYDDEAHTTTIETQDGDIRIEYYHEDGRISLIEDYNEAGELGLYQQYYYRDIRVPLKEE